MLTKARERKGTMAQVKEVELNSDIQTAMCDMDLSFLADAEVKQSRESSSSVGGESTEVDENTNTCNTAQPKEKQKQKEYVTPFNNFE